MTRNSAAGGKSDLAAVNLPCALPSLAMRRLAPLVLMLAAACSSGSSHASAPSPSPSPAALTGSAAFLAYAHGASFGTSDFASATDDQLLNVGNTACEGFSSNGLSYGRVVQGFVESQSKPTSAEAETLVREAVKDLCPDQASSLP